MYTISDIIESNQKSAVLAYLLLAAERSYSITELAKRLHYSEAVTGAVLREFEKISLVTAFSRDKHLFYIINPKHKLIPEIKVISVGK